MAKRNIAKEAEVEAPVSEEDEDMEDKAYMKSLSRIETTLGKAVRAIDLTHKRQEALEATFAKEEDEGEDEEEDEMVEKTAKPAPADKTAELLKAVINQNKLLKTYIDRLARKDYPPEDNVEAEEALGAVHDPTDEEVPEEEAPESAVMAVGPDEDTDAGAMTKAAKPRTVVKGPGRAAPVVEDVASRATWETALLKAVSEDRKVYDRTDAGREKMAKFMQKELS